MSDDLLRKVYQILDPGPLMCDENDKDLYVDLDPARGSAGVVKRMANKIRLSAKPTCQLLAGHRGSGKSTELRRLQRDLEENDPKVFVVFCEADEDVDRNDVDFPEVLVAIIRQMSAQLRQRAGIDLKSGLLKGLWDRLRNALSSSVTLEEVEVGAGIVKVSGAIKSSPDARLEIRKLLDRDASNWLAAANDLIGSAKLELRKKGYSDLLIVVDDLDKIVVRSYTTPENLLGQCLFVHREAQLAAFKCHMVYTMPLALAYSPEERVIASLYGGNIPVIPMIKIALRPPSNEPFPDGEAECRALIASRLHKVNLPQNLVFESDSVLESVIRLSGGQPRELILLIRESIVTDGLPVKASALERVAREGRRAYDRQLRSEQWPILGSVRATGRFERNEQTDAAVRELLDSRAILQYANDESGEWYDLNPLVKDLKPPERVSAS